MSNPINLYKIFNSPITTSGSNDEVYIHKRMNLLNPILWFMMRFETMNKCSKNPRYKKNTAPGMGASQMCLPILPAPSQIADDKYIYGEFIFDTEEDLIKYLEGVVPRVGSTIYFQDVTAEPNIGESIIYHLSSKDSKFREGNNLKHPEAMREDQAKMLYKVQQSRVMRFNAQKAEDYLAQGFLDLNIPNMPLISGEQRARMYWDRLVTQPQIKSDKNPLVYLIDITRCK